MEKQTRLNKTVVIAMVAMLVVGIPAMAAIVSYLSNTVSSEVSVSSPLTLQVSDGSGWEDDREYFKDRVKKRSKGIYKPRPEEIIVSHFFQGFEEHELGLEKGFTDKEFKEYLKLVEKISSGTKEDIGKKSDRVVNWLMELISRKGKFDEKMLEKIRKEFKKKIGKEVGKALKGIRK